MTSTYVVKDMLEWHTFVRAGRKTLPVHFTGGVTTPYGISGGRFTTDDPVIQYLIEHSEDFIRGRIYAV